MAASVEGVVDRGMHGQKTLRRSRRSEALHLSFPPSHRACELSVRLLRRKPLSFVMLTGNSALAAAYDGSLSVTNFDGTMLYLRISLRISRSAARLFRRAWTNNRAL